MHLCSAIAGTVQDLRDLRKKMEHFRQSIATADSSDLPALEQALSASITEYQRLTHTLHTLRLNVPSYLQKHIGVEPDAITHDAEGFVTTVDCSGESVTDAVVRELVQLGRLQILNLPFSQITDGGLAMVASAKNIRSLNLRNAMRITDLGIQYISRLPQLSSLLLVQCMGLTDACVSTLISMDELSYVNVTNSKISHEARARLSQSRALGSIM